MSRFLTIGHSNHTVEAWLALLRQHEVEVVVDTRSSPYSKYVPQFDRELMQRSLEQAGIRYLFLGAELGGRPANPTYYDAKGRVIYGRLCDDASFKAAIARLETGMERFRVALGLRRRKSGPLPSPPAHRPCPYRARPHHASYSRRRTPGNRRNRGRRSAKAAGRLPARSLC